MAAEAEELEDEGLPDWLREVQEALFAIGSVLADAENRLQLAASGWDSVPLELWIDELDRELVRDLQRLPVAVEEVLRTDRALYRQGTDMLSEATDSLYLGRGILYPIALEGALKLKEISYLHAEGYPAGEMKHGPIALVTDGFPVVAVATATATRDASGARTSAEIASRSTASSCAIPTTPTGCSSRRPASR